MKSNRYIAEVTYNKGVNIIHSSYGMFVAYFTNIMFFFLDFGINLYRLYVLISQHEKILVCLYRYLQMMLNRNAENSSRKAFHCRCHIVKGFKTMALKVNVVFHIYC